MSTRDWETFLQDTFLKVTLVTLLLKRQEKKNVTEEVTSSSFRYSCHRVSRTSCSIGNKALKSLTYSSKARMVSRFPSLCFSISCHPEQSAEN